MKRMVLHVSALSLPGKEVFMTLQPELLNSATFVGIDAHPDSHTAVAINRFKEIKGSLTFPNSKEGIVKFHSWLLKIEQQKEKTILGIEGGSDARTALTVSILSVYDLLFEVNPLYTKHKRSFGTRADKTDIRDAKLIAGVLTTEHSELPRITPRQVSASMQILKKSVSFYEDITLQNSRVKNQLHKLKREHTLADDPAIKEVFANIIRVKKEQLSFGEKAKQEITRGLSNLLKDCKGKNLTKIRGIGVVTAIRIEAHTGGIERFHNRNGYVRYAGIAPLSRSSGKVNRFVNTKRGNRKLNSVLYFAVLYRIIWDKQVKQRYEARIASGKTKREAILFLMRKTALLIYGMLRSGEIYRP
jgi:transposase